MNVEKIIIWGKAGGEGGCGSAKSFLRLRLVSHIKKTYNMRFND